MESNQTAGFDHEKMYGATVDMVEFFNSTPHSWHVHLKGIHPALANDYEVFSMSHGTCAMDALTEYGKEHFDIPDIVHGSELFDWLPGARLMLKFAPYDANAEIPRVVELRVVSTVK